MLRRMLLGGFVLLLGLGCLLQGWKGYRLSGLAKDEAQVLTCVELAQRGPGDNVHVALTKFVLAPVYAFEAKRASSAWSKVWVPVVPIDGEYARAAIAGVARDPGAPLAPPRDVHVLMFSRNAKDEASVTEIGSRARLEGLVLNAVEDLPDSAARILRERYPGVDLDRCWILEEGRGRPSLGEAGLWGAGGAMLLGGWVVALWRARASRSSTGRRRTPTRSS